MNPVRHLWGALVSFAFFIPTGMHAAPAASNFPVLTTPSVKSVRALNSAVLSVARAGDRLVAVGERGIVQVSDDNGRSWRQTASPVSVTLTAVQFVGDKLGWATGHFGIVLHTTDGGETWIKQLDGKRAAQLALQDAKARVSAGEEGAERALKEAQYLVSDGPDKPFLDLLFLNEHTGYVIGAYNLILRTEDGGRTWVSWQSKVENPTGMHLYAMHSVGDQIYIAGEQGVLLKGSWSEGDFKAVSTPYFGSYFGVIADSPSDVVIYGLRGNAYRSTDRGGNWSRVDLGAEVSISDGLLLQDGRVAMVNQTGQLFIADPGSEQFELKPLLRSLPATSIAEGADGAIIIGSLRGLMRIEPIQQQ